MLDPDLHDLVLSSPLCPPLSMALPSVAGHRGWRSAFFLLHSLTWASPWLPQSEPQGSSELGPSPCISIDQSRQSAGNVAQLVQCSPRMLKGLDTISSTTLIVVIHTRKLASSLREPVKIDRQTHGWTDRQIHRFLKAKPRTADSNVTPSLSLKGSLVACPSTVWAEANPRNILTVPCPRPPSSHVQSAMFPVLTDVLFVSASAGSCPPGQVSGAPFPKASH